MRKRKCKICGGALLLAVAVLLGGCGSEGGAETSSEPALMQESVSTEAAPTTEPTTSAENEIVIQTQYKLLSVPEVYMDSVEHQEVVQDEKAMEIFTLVTDTTRMELFRVYFGDESIGTLLGYLTGESEIPVTYGVSEYEDLFLDEETKEKYYQGMDLLGIVLDQICEDARFSQTKYTPPVQENEIALKYWTIVLPENMIWEERTEQGLYCVNFYGMLRNEKIPLFAIGLGEMEADYSVGGFLMADEVRPVNVKIYELPVTDQWTDEDIEQGYRMLSTVSDVIDTIVSHENFSEDMTE